MNEKIKRIRGSMNEKSNLLHNYYAVNSIDGKIKIRKGVINKLKFRIYRRIETVQRAYYTITLHHAYGK